MKKEYQERDIKKEYVEIITSELQKCEDISLLDLILKLLIKSR